MRIVPALALAIAATLSGTLLPVAPAQAQQATCRPWCVHYGGARGGGTNCGFVSFEQCQAARPGLQPSAFAESGLCPRPRDDASRAAQIARPKSRETCN